MMRSDPHHHARIRPAMAVFEVVGCHRDDPRVLLLVAGDGHYYRQALPDGHPTAIEGRPGDEWLLDRPPIRRPLPGRRVA
jgi:hypothetical protein